MMLRLLKNIGSVNIIVIGVSCLLFFQTELPVSIVVN